MLEIKNLHVSLEEEDKQILKGVDLTVEAGKVHAIMGPNGSGKSTLSYVLSGRDGYEVTEGNATLEGAEILDMEPEERAAADHRLGDAGKVQPHLRPLVEDDLQVIRRPRIGGHPDIRRRLRLQLGLPGPGRQHGRADRRGAVLEHHARRRQVV